MEEDINSPVVFDASAVLSFLMSDELTTPLIQQLFDKLAAGDIEVFAPQLLSYEVINTLRSSVKRNLKHNLSVYDASYLELAKSRKSKLISFNKRLVDLAN